ncbi:Clan CD, family C14, metacaspase-like cysteine peptidase [Histomonas meleagridis]|uniref:Clan CD, family C14, metacaspase-like cysteine peptidase n=1 Tax=Histomonas meleagridis TaxID=135588 RepID=UPI00355977B1|nr:Clan CD, family C14, metacaspase-like cysteine peptidase [Histomonas meleagridis]KAH0805226.1 Clan CD, family C14, metacaspase-like cysteine peptidase [Histomonas meleagridis]
MGGLPSQAVLDQVAKSTDIQMNEGFKKKDFQQHRGANTIDGALKYLNEIACDLSKQDYNKSPPKELCKDKILFICCNTYTKPKYQLGVGPLNDSITCAVNHIRRGFKVYFLHNSTPHIFMRWLRYILKNFQNTLTIFYTGHGASIKDVSGDEDDGYDECMVFDHGYVLDDDLAKQLSSYAKNGHRVLLLTDCCHSGSIWDIQSNPLKRDRLPKNIMSISAAKDDQTAKQTKMNQKDQGIFSYFFWKTLNENPKITSKQMGAKLNPLLTKYHQCYTDAATSPSMLDEPIFE